MFRIHRIENLYKIQKPPRIQAQVIRLWSETSRYINGSILKILFRDTQNNTIEAVGYGNVALKYHSLFHQYHYYDVSGFVVVPKIDESSNHRKLCNNNLKLYLTNDTMLEEVAVAYECQDDFTSISTIVKSFSVMDLDYVHVIGELVLVDRGNTDFVVFYIKDESAQVIECRGPNSIRETLVELLLKDSDLIHVLVLRFSNVLKSSGSVVLDSRSSVSEILINPLTTTATYFRSRFSEMKTIGLGTSQR